MRVTRALSTLRSKWNSSNKDQRCFFGFCIFSVCFTTNDFTRANSFRHPFAKSRGPYSNRTTKQKARTTNRTSQKSPRNKAMNERLSCSTWTVNAARGPVRQARRNELRAAKHPVRQYKADRLGAASPSGGGQDSRRPPQPRWLCPSRRAFPTKAREFYLP